MSGMPAAALGEMVVGECAGLFVCRGTDQVESGLSLGESGTWKGTVRWSFP